MNTEDIQLLASEAADANTTPERLNAIYEAITQGEGDKAVGALVWCALASNPHLPPKLISPLALVCPRAVANNLALATTYHDHATRRLVTSDAALMLLSVDNLPAWLVESFSSVGGGLREIARSHVTLVGERGIAWRKDLHQRVLKEWTWRVNDSSPQLPKGAHAIQLLLDGSGFGQWLLAPLEEALAVCASAQLRSPVAVSSRIQPLVEKMRQAGSSRLLNTFVSVAPPQTPEQLYALAARGEWPRHLVARHPQIPPDLWQRMAVEASGSAVDISLLLALAGNPTATSEMLEQWSKYKGRALREAVATHRHTPPSALALLAQDVAPGVRLRVARHSQVSALVLATLAQDVDSWVRGAVTRNAMCPPEVLAQLAVDESAFVRLDVARHAQTPPYVLEFLAEDEDADILGALAHRTDLVPTLRERIASQRLQVRARSLSRTEAQRAKDRHATSNELTRLADSRLVYVRYLVALHAHTPEDVVVLLAADSDVALALAQRSRLPDRLTEVLRQSIDEHLQELLASNSAIPFHVLLQTCEDALMDIKEVFQISTDNWAEYRKTYVKFMKAQATLCEVASFVRYLTKELDVYWYQSLLPRLRAVLSQLPITRPESLCPYPEVGQKYARELELMPWRWGENSPYDTIRPVPPREELNLQSMLSSPEFLTRAAALSHPTIPTEQLKPLNFLPEAQWLWRLAATLNPVAPRVLLEELGHDGHCLVRAAAQEKLRTR